MGLLHFLLTLSPCKDSGSRVLQEFSVKWSKLCLSYRSASISSSSFKDWGHGDWQKQTTAMHALAVLRHRSSFLENKMSSKNRICGNTRLLENVTFTLTVHFKLVHSYRSSGWWSLLGDMLLHATLQNFLMYGLFFIIVEHYMFLYKYTKSDNLDWPDVNTGYFSLGSSLFQSWQVLFQIGSAPLLFPHPSLCVWMMWLWV